MVRAIAAIAIAAALVTLDAPLVLACGQQRAEAPQGYSVAPASRTKRAVWVQVATDEVKE